MLQYTPDKLQWFLLTASGPISLLLLLIGFGLIIWMAYRALATEKKSRLYSIGLPGLALILASFVLSGLPNTGALADGVADELSETANFEDVKLLHIETVSSSPFADGSVSFVGTAEDVDGDPRQFRYTQYADFGIYDLIGFDKPEVNLKDDSFETTDQGLDILQGTAEPEATETPKATEAPATETPAPAETPAE